MVAIVECTLNSGTTSMPMTVQMVADRPMVRAMFSGTLMPISPAAFLLLDTQRIAVPTFVLLRKSVSAMVMSVHTTTIYM